VAGALIRSGKGANGTLSCSSRSVTTSPRRSKAVTVSPRPWFHEWGDGVRNRPVLALGPADIGLALVPDERLGALEVGLSRHELARLGVESIEHRVGVPDEEATARPEQGVDDRGPPVDGRQPANAPRLT